MLVHSPANVKGGDGIPLDDSRYNVHNGNVSGKLLAELRQTKPFASVEQEAYLNLIKTADLLQQGAAQILRGSQLTETQYNVLRILRGANPDGLKCGEIAERMVTRDPDITRLLDRLEKQGWIERTRSLTDRRVVTSHISEAGLAILAGLDEPLRLKLEGMLSRLGPDRLRLLIELLEEAR
jgi:MarR family transcriptional regulator, organic hydroperoxide resistance regulator